MTKEYITIKCDVKYKLGRGSRQVQPSEYLINVSVKLLTIEYHIWGHTNEFKFFGSPGIFIFSLNMANFRKGLKSPNLPISKLVIHTNGHKRG